MLFLGMVKGTKLILPLELPYSFLMMKIIHFKNFTKHFFIPIRGLNIPLMKPLM